MSKYIIDIPKTIGMGEVGSVHYTYFDGIQCQTIALKGDDLEELNSDYINEHFSDLQDTAYQRGLHEGNDIGYEDGFEDGKAQSERGCDGCKYESRTSGENPCFSCARNANDYWTAKQTDDEIEVGDEVKTKNGTIFVVTKVTADNLVVVGFINDGSSCVFGADRVVKTGRHFDIASILEEMRHD